MFDEKHSDEIGDNRKSSKTENPQISQMRKFTKDSVNKKPLKFEAEVIPYDSGEGADSPILAFSGDNVHIIFNIPKESFRRMATAAIHSLELCGNGSNSTSQETSPDSARDKNGNSDAIFKINLEDVICDLDLDNTAEVISAYKEDNDSRSNSEEPDEKDKSSTTERTRVFNSRRPPNYTTGCASDMALEISNSVPGNRRSLPPQNPLVNVSRADQNFITEIHKDVSVLLKDVVDEASRHDSSIMEYIDESRSSGNAIAAAVQNIKISGTRPFDSTTAETISETSTEGMPEKNRHSFSNLSADAVKYNGDRGKCQIIGSVVKRKDLVPRVDDKESVLCRTDVKKYKANIRSTNTFSENGTVMEDNIQRKTVDQNQSSVVDSAAEKNETLKHSNLTARSLDISGGSCPELESAWPDIYPFTETESIPTTELKSFKSDDVLTKYFKLELSNEFIVIKVSSNDDNFSIDAVKYKEVITNSVTVTSKGSSKETNSFSNRDIDEDSAVTLSDEKRIPDDDSESGSCKRSDSSGVLYKMLTENDSINHVVPQLGVEVDMRASLEEISDKTRVINISEANVKSGSYLSQSESRSKIFKSENMSIKQTLDNERESEASASKEELESSKTSVLKIGATGTSAEMDSTELSDINTKTDNISSKFNTTSTIEMDKPMDAEISSHENSVEDTENKQSTRIISLDIELKSEEVNTINASGSTLLSEKSFILEDSFKGSDSETVKDNPTEEQITDASENRHDNLEAKVNSFNISDVHVSPKSVDSSVETVNCEFPSKHISTSSPKSDLSNDDKVESSKTTSSEPPDSTCDAGNELLDNACMSPTSSNLEDVVKHTRNFLESEPNKKLVADGQKISLDNSVYNSKSPQNFVSNEENGISEETNEEDSKAKSVSSGIVQHEAGTHGNGLSSLQEIEDNGNIQSDNPVAKNGESDSIKTIFGDLDSGKDTEKNTGSQSPDKNRSGNQESGSSGKISAEDANGFPENTAIENTESNSVEKNSLENTENGVSEKTVIEDAEKDTSANIIVIDEQESPIKSVENKSVEDISNKDVESSSVETVVGEAERKTTENISEDAEVNSTDKTMAETKNKLLKNISTVAEKNFESAENEFLQNSSAKHAESSSKEKVAGGKGESLKNISAEHAENVTEEVENKSSKKIAGDPENGSAESTSVENVNKPEEIFIVVDESDPKGQTTKQSPSVIENTVNEVTNAQSVKDHAAEGIVNAPLKKAPAEDAESRSSVKVANGTENALSVNTEVHDDEDKSSEKIVAEDATVESPKKMAVEDANGAVSRETASEEDEDELPEETVTKNRLHKNLSVVDELKGQTEFDDRIPESTAEEEEEETEINAEAMSESDALESDEVKSVASESDDSRDSEKHMSKSDQKLEKNTKSNSETDETDCAPTRVRTRMALSGLSENAIPENTPVTKNIRSTETKLSVASSSSKSSGKVSPIGRSLRSKSLDPTSQTSKMPSHGRRFGGAVAESAEAARKKRAATPEVIIKKDIKISVRSSPRKATKAADVDPDSSATPKLSTRASSVDTQAKSRSNLSNLVSSVATRRTKRVVK